MSPESPGSTGLEDARWPEDDHWPEDDPDDDDWPGDEAEDDASGPPWPPGPAGLARPGDTGPLRQGGIRPLAVAAVAVVALAIGGVAALIARGASPSSPSAAQSPGSSQQGGVPGSGGGFPGGGFPGGGPVGQLLLRGKVVAVSSSSITIAGGSHTVTAAVTSATSVTGKVTRIGSVKVGDVVSAQIRESGGKATATAIQDPARQLSAGGLPPIGGSQP